MGLRMGMALFVFGGSDMTLTLWDLSLIGDFGVVLYLRWRGDMRM